MAGVIFEVRLPAPLLIPGEDHSEELWVAAYVEPAGVLCCGELRSKVASARCAMTILCRICDYYKNGPLVFRL